MLGCTIYGDKGGCYTNRSCSSSADCQSGSTCNASDLNVSQVRLHPDGLRHPVFTCTIDNGLASCVKNGSGDSGTDSGPHPYSGCFADTDCTSSGIGSKCLNAKVHHTRQPMRR